MREPERPADPLPTDIDGPEQRGPGRDQESEAGSGRPAARRRPAAFSPRTSAPRARCGPDLVAGSRITRRPLGSMNALVATLPGAGTVAAPHHQVQSTGTYPCPSEVTVPVGKSTTKVSRSRDTSGASVRGSVNTTSVLNVVCPPMRTVRPGPTGTSRSNSRAVEKSRGGPRLHRFPDGHRSRPRGWSLCTRQNRHTPRGRDARPGAGVAEDDRTVRSRADSGQQMLPLGVEPRRPVANPSNISDVARLGERARARVKLEEAQIRQSEPAPGPFHARRRSRSGAAYTALTDPSASGRRTDARSFPEGRSAIEIVSPSRSARLRPSGDSPRTVVRSGEMVMGVVLRPGTRVREVEGDHVAGDLREAHGW